MRGLLREPLVHFLIAGAALFLFSGYYGGVDASERSITLDEAQVGRLSSQWEQQWRRPPTPRELDGLIRDYIKEEVYFREALRLGLEADDPIIRRRLRTKMEFLATAKVENANPTEVELTRYYAANRVRYAADPVYSFDQRYYGESETVAGKAVVELNNGELPQLVSISLPYAMEKASTTDIAREFGNEFAGALPATPTAKWVGPVKSGYGWHAVLVRAADAATIPPLKDVAEQVTNDWRTETKAKREAAAYQMLLDGYNISIAKP